ncbi:MAG: hypothetical protein GTO62_08090, partial [Planctomycetales bacterium]|nr:hypothetical protein [Planctomycetales bacterium]NIP69215.1 hypothetical protein [Planctomycetales bacterium]
MNYGEVLSGAWQIIRKHRALWIFGILAGCGEGGGGGGGNAFQASGDEFPPEAERFFEQTIGSISEEQLFGIIAVVVLVLLIVFLIAIFLSNIGRIGLIRGTLLAEGGEQNIPFGELFQGSLPYFWRLLGLYLLVGLVILVLAIPVTLLFFAFGALTAGIGLI